MVTENPPTSPTASVTPSNRSGRLAASQCEPCTLPASSSGRKSTTTSRRGRTPARAHDRMTARIIASMSFMSTAPRPQMKPSASSAAKGGWDQSSAIAGTTSMCPCSSSAPG